MIKPVVQSALIYRYMIILGRKTIMNRLYVFYPSYAVWSPVWYRYGSMSDGQNTNVL